MEFYKKPARIDWNCTDSTDQFAENMLILSFPINEHGISFVDFKHCFSYNTFRFSAYKSCTYFIRFFPKYFKFLCRCYIGNHVICDYVEFCLFFFQFVCLLLLFLALLH